MSKDYDGVIRYSDELRTNSRNSSQRSNPINKSIKSKIIKGILIGVGICIIIAIVVGIYIFLKGNNKSDPPKTPTESPGTQIEPTTSVKEPKPTSPTEPKPASPTESKPTEQSRELGTEYEINTKKGDLKRIQVKQKYTEDRVRDGEKITTYSTRITNYDIYIMNEQNSDEENKYYYKKLYTCSIAIQSECTTSTNENCEPKQRIDLLNSARRNLEKKRNLDENNSSSFKDKPIPICLFNLTDNDAILSISCPESFPDTKRDSMVLDLYFFRPPGLKRLNNENINVTITRKTEGNRNITYEKNWGICDIENAQLSHCTTDMITTTDLNNNILKYDEEAIMNITLDSDNSYVKTKITNLTDESSKTENLNPQLYEEKLNNIIQKLTPYLKYKELFSKEDFENYYILNKEGSAALKKREQRNLATEKQKIISKENNLFHLFSADSGVGVDITLLNDIGLNRDNTEASCNFYVESNKTEDISTSKESSRSFNQIIKDLYILSKAGNHLATELYQNINTTLENMIEEINKMIPTLNKYVKNKDLSEIFDSTLSLDEIKKLPITIIQESTNLKKKLDEILNNVQEGGIKQNIKILNQNIYDYIDESRKIIISLFSNLNELSLSLSAPKNKLTEISSYYLNNTPTSYVSTIEKAKKILENYYKDEYKLISNKVDIIIKEFETKITESIAKEMKIIDNLYEKIENNNFTIKQANDEDIKTILNNLYYTKNFLKEIKEKIIEKLKKEMDIKANGYFISDTDMKSNQDSFSKIIEKALKISEQLDNDEFIDTIFDEVMSNIIRNFTKIMKYMDQQKEELFPLNEDVLLKSSFTSEIQNDMKNNITNAGVDILNKIRLENDYYLDAKQRVIKDFLDKNKEDLDRTVLELDNLFSVVNLEELARLYDEALNNFLEKTKNEINGNYLLSDEYFSTLSDDEKIKELLRHFHVDEQHLPYCISRVPLHEIYLTRFVDEISKKSKTQGYITKYNIFKDNFEKYKLYINDQLYRELLSEYQTLLSAIREILQVFKNNKISDKYPDLNELSFIDEHIRKIDNFYKRLDTYISDEIFNSKYIDKINNFKEIETKLIDNITDDIELKHSIINKYPLKNDYNYDFCVAFKRKKTYTCVNGAVFHYEDSKDYCLPAGPISDNYLNLSEYSYETDLGVSKFRDEFKEFNNSLSEKIYFYTSKINEIKKSLLDIETETINKEITLNYLSPVKDTVNSLLTSKYGDEIVKSSYNYYQPNLKGIIGPLLNDISNQWNQYYQNIYSDIEKNLENFKSSIVEIPNLANFYLAVLNSNITKSYFNSIEKHQKSELNYTITYYYNLLLKLVKSSHQYVISKLPSNPIGFNNIINKRKDEVNDIFNKLIKNIEDSQIKALNYEEQLDILDVAETNFFEVNDILKNNDVSNSNNLTPIISNMRKLKNNKLNDDISLASRFYLHNSKSGEQIIELYEQVDEKVFVYLNLEKFKNILEENWIFDQDEFIKELKDILYNSNLEIQKEFKTEKEKYILSLEEEITKTYTKDQISIEINKGYKDGIKSLELNQINDINQNINDILDKIKQEFTEEANLLNKTLSSYNKDFNKIQERLSNYKEKIIEDLKTNFFSVVKAFLKNINDKIYTNYYVPNLDIYLSQAKDIISNSEEIRVIREINLLSSSYDVGELVNNIIIDLTKDYKDFVKYEIISNYNKFDLELEKIYENQNWENLIKEKIDESFNSILLPILKDKATYDIGITGYNAYDLNDNIIKDIDEVISTKMDNIKNIIDSTKGDKFEDIKKWKKMDFSLIYDKITDICKSIHSFISSEGDNEKEIVDNFLKEIMISNFNELLQNIIPSFGNRFFERIINYNENFKISSLYNTLKYSLIPTVSYYNSLQGSNAKIKALTKDLKLKIFSLNDLDLTAQEKNKEILDLLKQKISEFIEESQEFLVNRYKAFFKNDVSIEQSFTPIILGEIKNELYELGDKFNDNYSNFMNKFFKDKLISSYTEVMNEKTKEMVLSVAQKRETLKSKLDDLFSLEPESVLNDINNKINNTLYSIDRFNSHFNTFQISENLENFLNNFGELNIQPKFDGILGILNHETKNIIVNTLDKNSMEYKNYYNNEEFIEKIDLTNNEIKDKYINNINDTIYNYGIEEYSNNLEKEINRQSQTIQRRRNRLLTEEEIEKDHKEKIADKAIDDTFSKILISSNNAKKFIDNFESFDNFDKIINDNINKLNIAYKKSSKIIKDNNYDEEIFNELMTKLINLKNFTLDYYTSINERFNDLKILLKTSINDIYNNINKCANLTYNTFSGKYEELSKVEEINSVKEETLGEISDYITIGSQNKATNVSYSIPEISQKTQFKFRIEFEEEGEVKKPKVIATIINGSKPKLLNIKFITPGNGAGDIIEKINVEPNNVNFTMSVYYTTKSKDLYVTTITDFESYKYSTELVQLQENDIEKCYWEDGIYMCYQYYEYTEDNPKILSSKRDKNIPRKTIIEESIVHESNLFE